MGISMAKTLQKHLSSIGAPPLSYTNRTLSRGAALEALGGIPCQTIGQVVGKTDIIFSSVGPPRNEV
jgi:3-hydroxyisobutyrate dehydrogenase-like beta-hydroxyacid dehydrogenase